MTIINRGSVGLTSGAITTATFGAGAIDAAAIAANAIGASELATDAVTEIVGTVVNTGGVATLAGALGDVANSSIAARLTTIDSVVDDILVDTGTTLDALIKDVPTVAEFNARTLPAADYLVEGDTLAAVTTVGSVTGSVGSVTAGVTLASGQLDTVTELIGNLGGQLASKTITHDGSASYTAFTVTGLVAVKVVGYVTTALTDDAATTSVGTATSAAGLIAATAGSAMQTANQVWVDDAPSKFETFPANWVLIGDGEDIVVDGDAALVAGVVDLYCWYIPISASASVVAVA